ncbi:MAG: CCA tRNA nucleotidyltransferase, partial [Pseudomonadota bacterium]
TTFRRDVETDGRRAVVAFAETMEEDAARRDFTMNALYADRAGTVIDPLGGLADLEARRVVFIGEAAHRIAEDHLRILRFFRFHAWFAAPGFDPEAVAAIAQGAEGLERLSRERVGAEMLKLLAAPDPAPSVATMDQVEILARILPGAMAAPLGPLVEAERAAGRAPDALARLAALSALGVTERLRLSRKDADVLHRIKAAMGETDAAASAYWHGERAAWAGALIQGRSQVGEDIARGAAAKCPVSAADFMDRFAGPALGARLKDVEARWVASGFSLSAEDLRKD